MRISDMSAMKVKADFTEMFNNHTRELDKRLEPIEANLKVQEAKFAAMDAKIDAEIKRAISSISITGSVHSVGGNGSNGGGGGAPPPPGSTNGINSNAPFRSRWVEVKNFVTDFGTRAGALTRERVSEFVEDIKANLDNEASKFVDWTQTQNFGSRVLFTKMLIWIKRDEKDNGWKVKRAVKEYIAGREINGRELRCVLEPHPAMKVVYAHGGKARTYLEKLIDERKASDPTATVDKANLQVEWGPPLRL